MPSLVSLYLLGAAIEAATTRNNQLSIHGRTQNGHIGPKPKHKPIKSEFDPNSTTQKRKAGRDNHHTPNKPGSNRNTLKAKRAARRRANSQPKPVKHPLLVQVNPDFPTNKFLSEIHELI